MAEYIQADAQKYAWGKPTETSKVAHMLGVAPSDANKADRYAELWIGVHDSKPSYVVKSPPNKGSSETPSLLLKDFIADHASQYLGQPHLDFYHAPTIPFLLKILSIDKALSIQAHPTRELAGKLHARDPKNYPDPNHKPELVVALTRYEALCCFRPVGEMVTMIKSAPPLAKLLGDGIVKQLEEAAAAAAGASSSSSSSGSGPYTAAMPALHATLERIYTAPQSEIEESVDAQLALIAQQSPKAAETYTAPGAPTNTAEAAHGAFVRTNSQFPKDVGLWMIYLLNYLVMQPGEALFLAASEPHAYISGDGVEIMANSDNVVRAGLTPKFKDVPTLLSMLTYDTNALAQSHYKVEDNVAPGVQQYQPQPWCDDFSLFVARLSKESQRHKVEVPLPSVATVIVVSGTGTVAGKAVEPGTTLVLPVGNVTVELGEGADALTVFFGTTNVHGATAAKKSSL